MKVKIGIFEVDVTAKTRNSERDTERFLNTISLALHEASEYERERDKERSADFYKMSDDIFEYLRKEGYYKE